MEDNRRQVKGGYLSIGQVEIVRYKPNLSCLRPERRPRVAKSKGAKACPEQAEGPFLEREPQKTRINGPGVLWVSSKKS